MGWGDSVGTSGRGGGYGGGHNSTGGSGGGFDGRDTPGAPDAKDGRRGSSMGRDGGIATGSSASPTAVNAAQAVSNFSTAATQAKSMFSRTANPQAKPDRDRQPAAPIAGFMGEVATRGQYGTFAEQADTQGENNTAYGNEPYAGRTAIENASQAAQMTRDQHTQSLVDTGVPDHVQANASPGLLGGLLSFGTGFANPIAGLAMDTGFRARDASRTLGDINDSFGTSLNDSYANSLGEQTKGAVAGWAGGQLGGQMLGRLGGRALGPGGAVVGGLLGSKMVGGMARDVAMNGMPSAEPGQSPGTPSIGAPGGPVSPSNRGEGRIDRAIADNRQQPATTPSPTQPRAPQPGVGTFGDYGSYARSFFA